MKLHIEGAIVVEGKYDKIHLSQLVDCPIIVTNGFGIFKDEETKSLIRFYADRGGITILTDSDSAGFKIRSYIKSMVPADKLRQVYIPDIFGKERRKTAPSKEGKLGVEGVDIRTIISSFEKSGVLAEERKAPDRPITRMDLFDDGLMGGANAANLRRELAGRLQLPARLSANGLLEALNFCVSYEEYRKIIDELEG